MTASVGAIKYEWVGDKLGAYVDILADYDYDWNVTINGTDPNGDPVSAKYLVVDNLVNATPVVISADRLEYYVPPFTRSSYNISSLSTLHVNLQNGPIVLIISNKDLGIPNESNQYLAGTVIDMAQYLLRDGTTSLTGNWDVSGFQIKGLLDPTVAQDAATKNYVDTSLLVTQNGVGALPRTLNNKNQDFISAFDFMTLAQINDVKNGTLTQDVTAALNAALTVCYGLHKTLFLPAGFYGIKDSTAAGYALLNRGASIVGEGSFYSQLIPLVGHPATSDFIRVEPTSGAYIDFMHFERFSVQPLNGGTKYGKRCIYMYFNVATNLSKFYMNDCYLLPGNDYSIEIFCNTAVNIQGVPANSSFERNYISEGIKAIGIGDSNNITENIFRTTIAGHPSMYIDCAGVSGTAMAPNISRNNSDSVGGFLYMVRGRCPKIRDNNIELSAGSGTVNGAIIDIDGSTANIPFATIEDNHIGVFNTATPTSAIRIATATGARVDKNTILSGVAVTNAILITGAANDTVIGRNEIQSNYVNAVNDSGLGTIGTYRTGAPKNGFTNTGGGYVPLSYCKDIHGHVDITGVLNCPGAPSGVVFYTLPAAYCPPPGTIIRTSCDAVVVGNIVSGAIEIAASGDCVYYGGVATRIDFAINFATVGYLAGSL